MNNHRLLEVQHVIGPPKPRDTVESRQRHRRRAPPVDECVADAVRPHGGRRHAVGPHRGLYVGREGREKAAWMRAAARTLNSPALPDCPRPDTTATCTGEVQTPLLPSFLAPTHFRATTFLPAAHCPLPSPLTTARVLPLTNYRLLATAALLIMDACGTPSANSGSVNLSDSSTCVAWVRIGRQGARPRFALPDKVQAGNEQAHRG